MSAPIQPPSTNVPAKPTATPADAAGPGNAEPGNAGPGTAAPPGRGGRRVQRLRATLTAYALIGPSLLGVLAFLLAPVVIVAVISLFRWNLLSSPKFIGLANYRRMAHDGSVWHSVLVTFAYVVLTIPVQTVLALLLAVMLNTRLRGVKVLRAVYVVPWMATPVVMGVVWRWIFDGRHGAVNAFLALFGVDAVNWLQSTTLALPTVAIVGIWSSAGYTMLFFLAGLQGIPDHLYEAARVDGATPVQQFFRITLPLLRPTMFFVLVTSVIGSFQVFDTVYSMTAPNYGGPGNATAVLNFKIYSTAFQLFDDGYASAIAMLLFGLLLVLTLAQVLYFRKRTTYEHG
ncbi:carbohydrate ABC transporter permease [Rugosimonospora africana]|uniref:Putative sugar ABC transporter, permease protein n=1 Tax=Rugosimonospora africana TaxID=556532 RepID=A0A8J3QQX2_9ACTN|nr:sugar ABC transporter permease [Rugosimonospora africana]GIH15269.1 putative sugar ABC transporter, permease protein [Rugosimonospora africana]